jgi:uncharacterized protein YbjT (DUF2867 family)
MIALTGVTGAIGGRVAAELAHAGAPLRLVVRDAARAPALHGPEVREVPGGYSDGDGMRTAMEGARTLFLVSGHESADRVADHRTVIDAAAAAGVGRIVYTSFQAAAPDAAFTLARDHHVTEEHIRSTGMAYTFLRDALYQDMLPLMVGEDGALRGPAGDGRLAAVAREDVAAAAAAVLTGYGAHDGVTYELTGPEALTLHEAAAQIGEATGRPARYEAETLEEAHASRAGHGAPDWMVEAWVSTYVAIARGEMANVTDDVQRLTGRPAMPLRETLRRAAPTAAPPRPA